MKDLLRGTDEPELMFNWSFQKVLTGNVHQNTEWSMMCDRYLKLWRSTAVS